jgi:hypothetical protein
MAVIPSNVERGRMKDDPLDVGLKNQVILPHSSFILGAEPLVILPRSSFIHCGV